MGFKRGKKNFEKIHTPVKITSFALQRVANFIVEEEGKLV